MIRPFFLPVEDAGGRGLAGASAGVALALMGVERVEISLIGRFYEAKDREFLSSSAASTASRPALRPAVVLTVVVLVVARFPST